MFDASAANNYMARPDSSIRWRVMRRAIVPALFAALWITSVFGEFAWGRTWETVSACPLPRIPGGIGTDFHERECSIHSCRGSLTVLVRSEDSVWEGIWPATKSSQWFRRWSQCDVAPCYLFESIFGEGNNYAYADMGPQPLAHSRDVTTVPIPYFLLTTVAAIPLLRLLWSNRRRRIAGLCRQCGYDLRAHRPGDRCPECGTFVPATSPPSPQ
jgi:hypothetical protein